MQFLNDYLKTLNFEITVMFGQADTSLSGVITVIKNTILLSHFRSGRLIVVLRLLGENLGLFSILIFLRLSGRFFFFRVKRNF